MTKTQADLTSLGRIGILGAGAVGATLARALAARGAHIAAVASQTRANAEALAGQLPDARAVAPEDLHAVADLVLLAVTDTAITPLAKSLPWRAG
ncbi:MAG: NAD(P)-binding domain-containing protein, partial [Ktedonobacterales bacterium]